MARRNNQILLVIAGKDNPSAFTRHLVIKTALSSTELVFWMSLYRSLSGIHLSSPEVNCLAL